MKKKAKNALPNPGKGPERISRPYLMPSGKSEVGRARIRRAVLAAKAERLKKIS